MTAPAAEYPPPPSASAPGNPGSTDTSPSPATSAQVAPRHVLFLDHTAALGGGEIALLNLVQQLDPARYRPTVILFTHGSLEKLLAEAGIDTRIRLLNPIVGSARKDALGWRYLLKFKVLLSSGIFVWRLSRIIRELRPDICHTNSLKSDVLGGIAARLAGVPVIWHVRDRISDDYLPRAVVVVFRILARFIPQLIIANSGATLETLGTQRTGSVLYSGIDVRGRARVVHDGTDTHIAGNATPYSRSSSYPIIGLVGRITPWKGQHIFLQAAALVHKRFPQARFQIIGAPLFAENDYANHVHQLAHDLGLKEIVEFTGFRKDIPELVAAMDILVHASTSGEPFGQVVIEGMAAGKPVVATDGGGIPEIVVHGVTGLLVPMGDADALAAAICRLLSNPTLAQRMGRIGRRRALEHFTIERTAEHAQDLYDEFLLCGAAIHRRHRQSSLLTASPARRPGALLMGHALAVGLSLAAFLTKIGMASHLGPHSPAFSTFFCAIILAAWVGGFWPGMTAAILCAVGSAYLLPPDDSFAIDRLDQPQFIFFVLVSLMTVSLIGQLHRARRRAEVLQHQAQAAAQRSAFLARAATELSFSADHDSILTDLADLATADLADWAVIDLIDLSGVVTRPVASHHDPDRIALAQRLLDFPPDPTSSHRISKVLRTAVSYISPRDGLLIMTPPPGPSSDDYLSILRQLGCASLIIVPLLVRGRTLGALSICRADAHRPFTREDMDLAAELASRGALAIENAQFARSSPTGRNPI